MVSLIARSPLAGLLPIRRGNCHLSEVDPGPITSIAPYAGREKPLAAALKSAHGLAFPGPGRILAKGAARIVWSGRDQAFLLGVAADPGLSAHAALTDQTDGWATLRLRGTGATAVLARLSPLDLRPESLPHGHSARSLLGHIAALFLRTDTDSLDIMVMRSFANTAWHELDEAMKGLAARG